MLVSKKTQSNIGFKTPNDFCLYLEQLKQHQELDSYMETVCWYAEHESDLEMSQIVSFLNKKFIDAIQYEATNQNMLREKIELVSIF